MMYPAGTPIIATMTSETDKHTTSECVLDMNSFAIVPASDVKARAKMRRDLLAYLEIQVDALITGRAHTLKIEARTA